jgi:hypothetical protein
MRVIMSKKMAKFGGRITFFIVWVAESLLKWYSL